MDSRRAVSGTGRMNRMDRSGRARRVRRGFLARRAAEVVVLLAGGTMVLGPALGADRILLRKLEVISDRTVVSFDEDGVVLDDHRVLAWDEIEKATVSNGQAEFDTMLGELGSALYRIRQRLSVGDVEGLSEPVESIYPRYTARRGRTAHLVFQAVVRSRLAAGRRESAVEPYLLLLECRRSVENPGEALPVPGEHPIVPDPATGLCDALEPIWFDADAARRELPRVGAAIGAMRRPWPPGAPIYYASLAAAAGETDRMLAALGELSGDAWTPWRDIIEAFGECARGEPGPAWSRLDGHEPAEAGLRRAAALYVSGRGAILRGADRRDAAIKLLRVPALYGTAYPELAAAALHDAMKGLSDLEDIPASVAVRNELLGQFGATHHARIVRREATPP
ncbi:MAG: hypothetical protein FJ297_09640 [Planctomycetes bacterium]|nr:hypothetical protein [Planctomycetota bacterium]